MRISDWSSDVCSSDLDWLRRSRVALSEDDLILSVGVQHGVHLAFLDLKDTSSLIATEGATYPGAIAAARALDMEMVPVRHDSEGMEPADLDMVLRSTGARIVYLTPVGHNPIGLDRQRVVAAKSVSVRVDLGGRR